MKRNYLKLAICGVVAISLFILLENDAHAWPWGKKKDKVAPVDTTNPSPQPPTTSISPAPTAKPELPPTPKPPSREATLADALRCEPGFSSSFECKRVSGPLRVIYVSFCTKQLDDGSTLPNLNLVRRSGGAFIRDAATFKQVNTEADRNRREETRYVFKGQTTPDNWEGTTLTGAYVEAALTPNLDVKNNPSWTHKLYLYNHSFTWTYKPREGNWQTIDQVETSAVEDEPTLIYCSK